MKFAIIAAGEGSRLKQEGIKEAKPLVRVNGERLIDRLLRIFSSLNAEEIVVVCNDRDTKVAQHLHHIQEQGLNGQPLPLHVHVQSTPSSMHSLHAIASRLRTEPFVLTTVDTVFSESIFRDYVDTFRLLNEQQECALMGVTHFIDDEKPLYVQTAVTDLSFTLTKGKTLNQIMAYHDKQCAPPCHNISAGIYGLTPRMLKTLSQCIEKGESRMRNYQRALLSDGFTLLAYPMGKVMDVDHRTDILTAELFLQDDDIHMGRNPLLMAVQRKPKYSPNSFDKDTQILEAVLNLWNGPANWIEEENLTDNIEADTFISMARSQKALDVLNKKATQGHLVMNCPPGVLLCKRDAMDSLLKSNGITVPSEHADNGIWLKKGDGWSECEDDVVFCHSETEVQIAMERFRQRGIVKVVKSAHIDGDLVKFYGVGKEDFWYFYPTRDNDTKYNDELKNGPVRHLQFKPQDLHGIALKISELSGVEIYGGDAIVTEKGEIVIIDFNDFPSFSRCRKEAAQAIIKLIHNKYINRYE